MYNSTVCRHCLKLNSNGICKLLNTNNELWRERASDMEYKLNNNAILLWVGVPAAAPARRQRAPRPVVDGEAARPAPRPAPPAPRRRALSPRSAAASSHVTAPRQLCHRPTRRHCHARGPNDDYVLRSHWCASLVLVASCIPVVMRNGQCVGRNETVKFELEY